MSDSAAGMLPDLSEDSPCGEDLELDPDFTAMERASEGTPEQQYGSTVIPAEPPNWKEVQSLALSMLDRTRDIRVLVQLAIARLNLSGIPAFAETLSQIRHLIETRWEQVHPRLDPEDDNDPTLRANTLVRLQDPRKVLRPLREAQLARDPRAGVVTWRDIAVCLGQLDPEPGAEKPSETFIRGVFSGTDRDRLTALHGAVDLAVSEIDTIGRAFGAAADQMLSLEEVLKLLRAIQADLKRFAPAGDAAAAAAEADIAAPGDGGAGGMAEGVEMVAVARRPAAITARSLSGVTQRDDALYLMELAAAYFRANEPSSPVPLLLDRARRLAGMEFMEILQDMAFNGIEQARLVAGPPPE